MNQSGSIALFKSSANAIKNIAIQVLWASPAITRLAHFALRTCCAKVSLRVSAATPPASRPKSAGCMEKAAQPKAQQQARHAYIARRLATHRHHLACAWPSRNHVGHQPHGRVQPGRTGGPRTRQRGQSPACTGSDRWCRWTGSQKCEEGAHHERRGGISIIAPQLHWAVGPARIQLGTGQIDLGQRLGDFRHMRQHGKQQTLPCAAAQHHAAGCGTWPGRPGSSGWRAGPGQGSGSCPCGPCPSGLSAPTSMVRMVTGRPRMPSSAWR